MFYRDFIRKQIMDYVEMVLPYEKLVKLWNKACDDTEFWEIVPMSNFDNYVPSVLNWSPTTLINCIDTDVFFTSDEWFTLDEDGGLVSIAVNELKSAIDSGLIADMIIEEFTTGDTVTTFNMFGIVDIEFHDFLSKIEWEKINKEIER